MMSKRQEATEKLRDLLPPGTTVYTILRSHAPSGMSRVIDMVVIHGNRIWRVPPTYVEAVTSFHWNDKAEGYRIGGTGMDMGFDLVYTLSSAIYRGQPGVEPNREGYVLSQSWL
jgi:hypothetical protein